MYVGRREVKVNFISLKLTHVYREKKFQSTPGILINSSLWAFIYQPYKTPNIRHWCWFFLVTTKRIHKRVGRSVNSFFLGLLGVTEPAYTALFFFLHVIYQDSGGAEPRSWQKVINCNLSDFGEETNVQLSFCHDASSRNEKPLSRLPVGHPIFTATISLNANQFSFLSFSFHHHLCICGKEELCRI